MIFQLRYGIKTFTFLIHSKKKERIRSESDNERYIKTRAQSPDVVFQRKEKELIGNVQDETNINIAANKFLSRVEKCQDAQSLLQVLIFRSKYSVLWI